MHNPFTAGRVLAASLVFAAFSIAPTGALAQDALAQDELAEAGEAVFKKCQACHSLEAGRHRAGPSLAGISEPLRRRPMAISIPPRWSNPGWFGMPEPLIPS